MSSGHRTLTVFLTVISGLFLTIVGLYTHWPPWGWAVSGAGLLGAAHLAGRVTAPRADPLSRAYGPEPDVPVPPRENREQRVRDVALSTSVTDYDFLLSATVRWCPVEIHPEAPPISPAGLAVSAVLDWARQVTSKLPPHRHAYAQHQLEGALGTMRPDPTGRLLVMAENITLALAEDDARRLTRLSTVRKDEALWEHERKWERSKRAYLGTEVLRNTGTAVVWWLAKNDDHIRKTVDDLGVLVQLTSAANNRDVPRQFQHVVPYPLPEPALHSGNGASHTSPQLSDTGSGPWAAETPPASGAAEHFEDLLHSIGLRSDDEQVPFLAEELAALLDAFKAHDAADQIRKQYDAPSPPPESEAQGWGAGRPDGKADPENDPETEDAPET